MSWLGWIRQRTRGISTAETSFARRGFPVGDAALREHLEASAGAFVDGYNGALRLGCGAELVSWLEGYDRARRGFAYEGAGMAACLCDRLVPGRRGRFAGLLRACDDRHTYMLHVGAGWAVARVPWARRRFERALTSFDPLLRWLAVDGYGFHEGFFNWRRMYEACDVPAGLSAYGRRVFDHGLGRCSWFVGCGDPERIAGIVARFPAARRGDLWCGVALAATYAGGCPESSLQALRSLGEPHRAALAQGAAFAAKARLRAANETPHTEVAARVFCGISAVEAAAITDECLIALPPDGDEPAYEAWRRRIQRHFVDAAAGRMHDGTCAANSGESAATRDSPEQCAS